MEWSLVDDAVVWYKDSSRLFLWSRLNVLLSIFPVFSVIIDEALKSVIGKVW